jgi:hypothetical protein
MSVPVDVGQLPIIRTFGMNHSLSSSMSNNPEISRRLDNWICVHPQ